MRSLIKPTTGSITSKVLRMKQKFTLSKVNKIYYGICTGLAIFLLLIFSPLRSALQFSVLMGSIVGVLISFLLYPALFGWIFWHFSGKKEGGGRLAFNIALTLVLLLNIMKNGYEYKHARALGEDDKKNEDPKDFQKKPGKSHLL